MRKVLAVRATTEVGRISEHGNTTIDVLCPFCERVTTAYVWSISGCGKACETEECDTILYRAEAHKLFPALTEKQEEVLADIHNFKCADIGDGWYPNRRVLNGLIDKGYIKYGKWPPESARMIGFYITDLAKLYLGG